MEKELNIIQLIMNVGGKVNAVWSDNQHFEMWVFKATWDNQQKSSEPKLQVHHSDLIERKYDENLT